MMTKGQIIAQELPVFLGLLAEELRAQSPDSKAAMMADILKLKLTDAAALGVDKRAIAWTEERRKEHSIKVREAAKRRQAGSAFKVWQWLDEAPKTFETTDALCNYLGISPNSFAVTMSRNGGLGFVRVGGPRQVIVAAKSESDRDRLLSLKYEYTRNPQDLIELPAKKGGRF